MRRGNGDGCVMKNSGRRRKPYRVRVTKGWQIDAEKGTCKQVFIELGSYKTRKEAERVLADYFDSSCDADKRDILFSEIYAEWYTYFMAKGNQSYEYRLKSAYKYCSSLYDKKFREITILDMEKCIDTGYIISTRGSNKGEKQLASPSSKESMKFLFNHIYDYALKANIVRENLARRFTLDKSVERTKAENKCERQPFSEDEIKMLWGSEPYVPFVDMLLVGIYSGWRPTELVSLRVDNISLEEDTMKGGIKTAAGKNRCVPIHPRIRPLIEKRMFEAGSLGSDFLFNDASKSKGVKGLSYDQYLSRFNNIMEQFKFVHTPHETRHTFITRAKYYNLNENVIKLIVGHNIRDVTERVYTHRTLEQFHAEIQKIKE